MNERNRENGLQLGGRLPMQGESRIRREAPLPPEPSRSMLSDYLRTFNRHRLAVGLCALGGLTIALLAGLGAEPVYRTRTSLNVENLNGEFLNQKSINPTGGMGDGTSEENVQTQIKLLESDTLLEHTVVTRLKAGAASNDVRKGRYAFAAAAGDPCRTWAAGCPTTRWWMRRRRSSEGETAWA